MSSPLDFLAPFNLPTAQKGAAGTCGMAVPGARMHPSANARNGKNLSDKKTPPRHKNMIPSFD
jgi:hypothetical protein